MLLRRPAVRMPQREKTRSTKAWEAGAHIKSCAIGASLFRLLFFFQNWSASVEPPVDTEVLVDVLWIPTEDTGLCCQFGSSAKYCTNCDLVVSVTFTERGVASVKAIAFDEDDWGWDIFAAKNLQRFRAGGMASAGGASSATLLKLNHDIAWCVDRSTCRHARCEWPERFKFESFSF